MNIRWDANIRMQFDDVKTLFLRKEYFSGLWNLKISIQPKSQLFPKSNSPRD